MMAGGASEVSRYYRNELGRFWGPASCQFIHPRGDGVVINSHLWLCMALWPPNTNYLYRLKRSIRYLPSNGALPSTKSDAECPVHRHECRRCAFSKKHIFCSRPKGSLAVKVKKSEGTPSYSHKKFHEILCEKRLSFIFAFFARQLQ